MKEIIGDKGRGTKIRLPGKLRSGVMTVEAALVLPLFLVAMITIGCILNMYYTHVVVGEALDNSARTIAAWAYPVTELGNSEELNKVGSGTSGSGNGENTGENLNQSFSLINTGSAVALGAVVTSRVRGDPVASSMLKGSVICLRSTVLNDEGLVDLVAEYELRVPFDMFINKGMRFLQRSRVHAWTGYVIKGTGEDADENEEYVYVTTNGTVYHRSESCTYLKPSVRGVNGSGVKNLRNTSGARYYGCEVCHPSANPTGTVYITTYGTRYHSSSSCSAIERNYRKVPLSQVEGVLPPCSKCGGK